MVEINYIPIYYPGVQANTMRIYNCFLLYSHLSILWHCEWLEHNETWTHTHTQPHDSAVHTQLSSTHLTAPAADGQGCICGGRGQWWGSVLGHGTVSWGMGQRVGAGDSELRHGVMCWGMGQYVGSWGNVLGHGPVCWIMG